MASKGKGGAQHSSFIAMNQCLLCFSWKLKLQPRWVKNIYVCLDMRAILKNVKVNKKNCTYLKGQFSIRTSTSQFDHHCNVINLHLVLLL